MENTEQLNNLQYLPYSTEHVSETSETESNDFLDYNDLDETQRKEIDGIINDISNAHEGSYQNSDEQYYLYNASPTITDESEEASIKSFLSVIFDIEKETLVHLNIYDTKKTRAFLSLYLKDWYYPSKEVEAFAEFVRNGGSVQEFAEALAPIDFGALSDEEAVRVYYANRMDGEALEEYISTLKNAGKLEKKAKEIKKEVGVIELSSDEILSRQREMQAKQKEWLNKFKQAVSETIYQLGLKFKSSDDRDEFIDLITEPKHHYNDKGQLEFIGSEYGYILNADIAALVISAFHLYNYDTDKKRQKAVTETIDNIKRNLIQNRNLGIANFGL